MATNPDVPPSIGPVAGKYALTHLIGRGGMGTVWEARHVTLGTRVAIKFIDVEYTDSQEARTRFDNEARAAATIESKHAIQIFDHGVTDDGQPYIVMELLLGEALDARLDRVGRLPLGETARILRQVGRALARAHERGIVHRDLKPENIFLVRTPDEDEEIAKVLDFGIAKFKKVDGQSGGLTSSTKTGAVLGTPFYMAPEQARGLRDLDHRVDLWAMGVIAFRCVCGLLPFEGVSVGDLLVKICTTPAPIPSRLVPALPPAFDAWFLRALEKEPARRFQNALELSDALAGAAGLSVRHGSSLSPGSPSSDPAAALATTNLSSAGLGLGLQGANATSAPFTASNPAPPGLRSPSRAMWIASTAAVFVGLGLVLGLGVGTARYWRPAKAAPPPGLAQSANATSSSTATPPPSTASASAPVESAPLAPGKLDGGFSEAKETRSEASERGSHHHPGGTTGGGHLPSLAKASAPGASSPPPALPTASAGSASPLARPGATAKPAATSVDLGY